MNHSPDRQHEKRHANAWDATLSDEQRDLVFRKATMGGFSWGAVTTWIAEEFAIKAPSRSAFYDFLDWWRPQYVARRIQEKVMARDALREERSKVGDMSPELAQSLEDQANELIAGGNIAAGKCVFDMAAKIRDDLRKHLEIATRREALELEKQRYRDSVQTAIERGLDALAVQTQGNAVALEHYRAFRAAIAERVKEAA